MPDVPIPAGFCRVRVDLTQSGSTKHFSFGWDQTEFDPGDTLGDNLADWLTTDEFGDYLTTWFTVTKFNVRTETTSIDRIINVAGSRVVSSILAPNSALLVEKKTALAGRSNRGRMYVPGLLGEAEVSNIGEIVTGLATLQACFTALAVIMGTGGGDPSMNIIHGPTLADPTEPFATPTPITQLLVDNFIATQRRRLR